MATKSQAGVNNGGSTAQGVGSSNTAAAVSGSGDGSGGGGGVGIAAAAAKLHSNTVLLKTVSAFLASSKRNSSTQSKASEVSLKTKRRLKKERMDELSGKINPKLLEQLRKKTRFTK